MLAYASWFRTGVGLRGLWGLRFFALGPLGLGFEGVRIWGLRVSLGLAGFGV